MSNPEPITIRCEACGRSAELVWVPGPMQALLYKHLLDVAEAAGFVPNTVVRASVRPERWRCAGPCGPSSS